MVKRNFKRLAALLVSATMLVGSCMTVFADGTDGTGSYEGGEMQYPTLSVTLPTVPTGAYNYIADPNDLISTTSAAAYDGATFTGTGGVYFKTKDAEGSNKAEYSGTSKALELKNENAQDIDVTIKLEQKTAGSEGIAYSDTATFDSADKAQKIYLAVTDGADTNPKTAALSATTPATLTTKVEGKTANYKASWDSTNKYGYVLDDTKKVDGAYVWNSCSYALTGALNKGAEWGQSVTFPAITVTWSYAEHSDAPAAVDPAISNVTEFTKATPADVVITFTLGSGDKAVEADGAVLYQGSGNTAVNTAKYTVSMSGKTVTIDKSAGFMTSATADVPIKLDLTKNGTVVKSLTGTITIN